MNKTLKGIGRYTIDSTIEDNNGTRILSDFLENMLRQFFIQSKKYIDATLEAPYAYSEKQLNTLFAPAFDKFAQAFLCENPVNRKVPGESLNDKKKFGWVDYWVRYRNVDFLIEIKHSYASCRTGKVRDSSLYKWEVANGQFSSIRHEAKESKKYTKGCFIIVLNVFTLYEKINTRKEPKYVENEERMSEIIQTYKQTLKPQGNWFASMLFHESVVESSVDEVNEYKWYYPGVFFIAKVSNLI